MSIRRRTRSCGSLTLSSDSRRGSTWASSRSGTVINLDARSSARAEIPGSATRRSVRNAAALISAGNGHRRLASAKATASTPGPARASRSSTACRWTRGMSHATTSTHGARAYRAADRMPPGAPSPGATSPTQRKSPSESPAGGRPTRKTDLGVGARAARRLISVRPSTLSCPLSAPPRRNPRPPVRIATSNRGVRARGRGRARVVTGR